MGMLNMLKNWVPAMEVSGIHAETALPEISQLQLPPEVATLACPESAGTRIAALLTCHNRRASTLLALRRLFAQEVSETVKITVFLVDDGSDDGTGAAVASEFPRVRLLQGDGSLFWSGGMRLAFNEAAKTDFDYYLWLNDDTLLDRNAIASLLMTHRELTQRRENCSIVVGSTYDPETRKLTYGGVVRTSPVHPFKFRLLEPVAEPRPCATINGNAVLIPREVARRVGNISRGFTHSMGDFDYGLRARRLGCTLWVAPGYVGSCRRNGVANTWMDTSLPFSQWMRRCLSMKGLPPREYRRFVQAHGGPLWPLFWSMPYVRVALTWARARIQR